MVYHPSAGAHPHRPRQQRASNEAPAGGVAVARNDRNTVAAGPVVRLVFAVQPFGAREFDTIAGPLTFEYTSPAEPHPPSGPVPRSGPMNSDASVSMHATPGATFRLFDTEYHVMAAPFVNPAQSEFGARQRLEALGYMLNVRGRGPNRSIAALEAGMGLIPTGEIRAESSIGTWSVIDQAYRRLVARFPPQG